MNIELDTWEVINSYFRDIPNYLVRHHIDSYNDFIQNKIPQIMHNFSKIPPYVLIDKEDRNITYEIKVFYGGKTHDRYKITKPTIINYPSGEVRQLFPVVPLRCQRTNTLVQDYLTFSVILFALSFC